MQSDVYSRQQASLAGIGRRSRGVKIFRIFAAVLICTCLLIGLSIAGLYFLFKGKTEKGSPLVARVEQSLQSVIGPNYNVDIEAVDLSFLNLGQVSLGTDSIIITRKEDGAAISTIGSLEATMDLYKTLSGETNFSYLTVKDAKLDASLMGPNTAFILPSHLDAPLNILGNWLSRLEEKFSADTFKGMEITNAVISGQIIGRKQTDPLKIEQLVVEPGSDGQLLLSGKLDTNLSNIKITSDYNKAENGWTNYNFSISGIHAGEWLNNPETESGFFANNAIINVKGDVSFNPEHEAFEPRINLSSDESDLRLGVNALAPVKVVDLNFRLFLDRNQIELDPSYLEIGRLKAELIGGIKPANETSGYAGNILYDLIMKRGTFEPTIEGEPVVPVGIKAAGVYSREAKELGIDDIIFTSEKGHVSGNATVGFMGETPSVKGEGKTDGISVAALKQFWPYFIGGAARQWVHSHVAKGWITNGTVKADIPSGVLFRLSKGKTFSPEQFTIKTSMKDLSFRAFGKMPNITDSIGDVRLEGMKISAAIKDGYVEGFEKKDVQIRSGSFVTNNFADPKRVAKTKLTLDGDVRSIARISDREPLRVMNRMKVVPDQFSGKMHADIVADFPLGKPLTYGDIQWNVLMDLENAKSSKKLGNRSIEKANILIDANPSSANVSGVAVVDGVKTRLSLIEPIGKSGKVKRKRIVTSTLTEKDRERLGINLSPVLYGNVDIEVTEQGSQQFYKVDLTKARVEFPWVGWSKGEGIPAKGSFVLSRKKEIFSLKNLNFSGNGFGAKGDIVVSKKGLLSANLKGLKLNDGDDISLKVKLTDNVYNINAAGLSYDARGIMNTLIYESNFEQAQGGRSVNLVANFGRVMGFEGRYIENVLMLYESRKGKLRKLDLRGTDQNARSYSVQANRAEGKTYFNIKSDNAGNALAFTNIYTKMRSGFLDAKLVQADKGPYIGPVQVTDFTLVNEPRLAGIVSSKGGQTIITERGELPIRTNTSGEKVIKFQLAQSQIEKGKGYMNVKDAVIRSNQVGMSMNGVLYDANDRMNITGTYMPANAVNLAVSTIPILSQLFSNGRDNALIGITYKLEGKRSNPKLLVNPLSVVAPGVFKKVFEFKN